MYNSKYRYELDRLESFKHWPKSHIILGENLAAAGFYYIGSYDHTECFECGTAISCWEKDDDPWFEHLRWAECCTFIRGKSNNNVPLMHSVIEVAIKTHRKPNEILRDIERAKDVTGIFKDKSSEKSIENTDSRLICKICLEREIQTLFLPCKHLFVCGECADKLNICCICRKTIAWKLNIYLA